jgi:C-terminal processing protease CtpA/Prc
VLDYCKDCQGIILDLRGNAGGEVPNVMTLLKCLPCEKELYKIFVRQGGDRNNLIQQGVMLRPDDIDESRVWRKPFIVLIDNLSYSATSTFSMCAKGCENVRLVGVKTAGGTNTPLIYELSNGWLYRLPSIKFISNAGVDYQNGVPPDVEVHLDMDAVGENIDNIIETACEMIESPGKF